MSNLYQRRLQAFFLIQAEVKLKASSQPPPTPPQQQQQQQQQQERLCFVEVAAGPWTGPATLGGEEANVGVPGVGATSENKKLRRWAPSSYKRSYIVTIYYTYCRVIVLVTLFVMPFFWLWAHLQLAHLVGYDNNHAGPSMTITMDMFKKPIVIWKSFRCTSLGMLPPPSVIRILGWIFSPQWGLYLPQQHKIRTSHRTQYLLCICIYIYIFFYMWTLR